MLPGRAPSSCRIGPALGRYEYVASPSAVGHRLRVEQVAAVRLLVTGVRGFIGAAVATGAHARGYDVVGVDAATDGRTLPPGVPVLLGDVTDPAAWFGELGTADAVVHCAAVHQPGQITRDPVRSIEVNLRGTRMMLEAASAAKVRRFVHLSSAKVYGEPLHVPSSEDDLLNPVEPYGLAKAVSEQTCAYVDARSAMLCLAVRPFSVYGPGQDLSTGYVGQLLEGWRTGGRVTLTGEPDYVRDFVHVDDVVGISLAAAETDHDVHVVNAGSGHATSLRELVSSFTSLCGDDLEVQYAPARAGTITRTLADTRRSAVLLGRPAVRLQEGLPGTLRSFTPADLVDA